MRKIILAIFLIPILAGCAPKFMTRLYNYEQAWDSIPLVKDLSVRVSSSAGFSSITKRFRFEDKDAEDLFIKHLMSELKSKMIFNNVYLIADNENPTTDLLLEIKLEYYKKSNWFERAFDGGRSQMGLYGTLINLKKDKAIITYSKERGGTGGFFNGLLQTGRNFAMAGILLIAPSLAYNRPGSAIGLQYIAIGFYMGLANIVLSPLTPNEKTMVKYFVEWGAEDIAKMIEINIHR